MLKVRLELTRLLSGVWDHRVYHSAIRAYDCGVEVIRSTNYLQGLIDFNALLYHSALCSLRLSATGGSPRRGGVYLFFLNYH